VAEFTSHVPGTFCWPELATTDQKAASRFYSGLFGWAADEVPIGPADVYVMFRMRGLEVGAAAALRPDQQGVPPHWNTYVSVANVDESLKRAQELGGKVLGPAFDVMDAGRMGVLQDPTGAVFFVWQANNHPGARILREPGALGWTELNTNDTEAASRFYTQLFGWHAKTGSVGSGHEYTEFSVGGHSQGGMMKIDPSWGDVPPNWIPYFEVNDCDAAAAKAKELGGDARVPPTDIPNVGRFAMLADGQGAMFAIIKVDR
jgi:predicted enzyme related to lactoylglutathione lyase